MDEIVVDRGASSLVNIVSDQSLRAFMSIADIGTASLRAYGVHIDKPARSWCTMLPSFEAELLVDLIIDFSILKRVFLCIVVRSMTVTAVGSEMDMV